MTDETPSTAVQAKAAKYLLSGNVRVQHADEHTFHAHVTPSSGGDPYFVKFTRNGWHCDCPARVHLCAHIVACQTIARDYAVSAESSRVFETDPDIDKLLEGI